MSHFHTTHYQYTEIDNSLIEIDTYYTTNFIITDTKSDIIFTKGNQIYLRGRFINYHKKSDDWVNEFKYAANFNLISNTILTITKEINIIVSCRDHRTSATIPANSIIKVPHKCSIACDSFEIPKLRSTSSINVEYNLKFLQLSHGHNGKVIVH